MNLILKLFFGAQMIFCDQQGTLKSHQCSRNNFFANVTPFRLYNEIPIEQGCFSSITVFIGSWGSKTCFWSVTFSCKSAALFLTDFFYDHYSINVLYPKWPFIFFPVYKNQLLSVCLFIFSLLKNTTQIMHRCRGIF